MVVENWPGAPRSVDNFAMRELTESHREAQERFFSGSGHRRASVRERGVGSYPTSESCCAGGMAGLRSVPQTRPLYYFRKVALLLGPFRSFHVLE